MKCSHTICERHSACGCYSCTLGREKMAHRYAVIGWVAAALIALAWLASPEVRPQPPCSNVSVDGRPE